MTISLAFYADSALTQPLASNPLALDRAIGGSPVDAVVYLGSATAGRQFTADAGGSIQVAIGDGDPSTGFAVTDIALALSQAGLSSATPGAILSLSTTILSGAVNAVAIWLRFSGTSATPLTTNDLSLTTNTLREYAQ